VQRTAAGSRGGPFKLYKDVRHEVLPNYWQSHQQPTDSASCWTAAEAASFEPADSETGRNGKLRECPEVELVDIASLLERGPSALWSGF
jgi:hypothetical protein